MGGTSCSYGTVEEGKVMKKLTIVKIGGEVLDNAEKLNVFLNDFSQIEGAKILVHGGGKLATQLANKVGVNTELIDGRRITDKDTLPIAVMVYAGLINKQVVAQLQSIGCDALGLSGADGRMIQTVKRSTAVLDYGFVGDCTSKSIYVSRLQQFLELGLCPVFSAITVDNRGQLLNTNADTIASCLAIALSFSYKVSLVYCFEHKGVLQDIENPNAVIPSIDHAKFELLKGMGIITKGMLPKIENARQAVEQGVSEVWIKSYKSLNQSEGTCIQ